MSFKDCIDQAEKEGRLSKDKASEARALYDEFAADMSNTMFADAGDVEAARKTYEAMAAATARKKRITLLQAKRWSGIEKDLTQFRDEKGRPDMARAMAAHLSRDDAAPFSNVEARHASVLSRLQGQMTDLLEQFHTDLLGRTRNPATLLQLVREVFGEDTKNPKARELAEAWSQTAERARQWFNAAGGDIAQRKDWGMPQSHNSVVVNKAGYGPWRDFIQPLLDRNKMVDGLTGQPFSSEGLELALRNVYETIRTDGLNKVSPGKQARGSMLANRRLDHRFLVFKDADSWLTYNARFGDNDPFSTMMSHLDHMARDIASLQILGPNPTATLRYMEDLSRKQGVELDRLDHANSLIHSAWEMWGLHSGSALAPVNGQLARTMAGVRSVLQAAQLGSAVFSSLTDLASGRIARQMAGLPQVKMISSYLKLLNPADAGDRKLAIRLSLGAQGWSSRALGQMRYFGETGPEITRRMSSAVSSLSGHTPWIQSGRWAFGMEFMGELADHAGTAFDALPEPLRNTMQRYGIGADRWDALRSSPLYHHEGTAFLRPEEIAARADMPAGLAEEHAFRLLEMIQGETNFAVPTTSLRGRAALVGSLPAGTIKGELLRSGIMYKSFAVTMMHTHLTRAMMQQGLLSKAGYFANFVISTTLMGALAIQLKQIARGVDPQDMTTPEFWGRAIFQGGGLGIFGDFLEGTKDRWDHGLATDIGGPVVGLVNDAVGSVFQNVTRAIDGRPTSVAKDLISLLRQYTPGGTIWYIRAAFGRLILDNLQRMTDPDAQDHFRRTEQSLRSQTGQRYWWRPGQNLPSRAPDVTAIKGK